MYVFVFFDPPYHLGITGWQRRVGMAHSSKVIYFFNVHSLQKNGHYLVSIKSCCCTLVLELTSVQRNLKILSFMYPHPPLKLRVAGMSVMIHVESISIHYCPPVRPVLVRLDLSAALVVADHCILIDKFMQ